MQRRRGHGSFDISYVSTYKLIHDFRWFTTIHFTVDTVITQHEMAHCDCLWDCGQWSQMQCAHKTSSAFSKYVQCLNVHRLATACARCDLSLSKFGRPILQAPEFGCQHFCNILFLQLNLRRDRNVWSPICYCCCWCHVRFPRSKLTRYFLTMQAPNHLPSIHYIGGLDVQRVHIRPISNTKSNCNLQVYIISKITS